MLHDCAGPAVTVTMFSISFVPASRAKSPFGGRQPEALSTNATPHAKKRRAQHLGMLTSARLFCCVTNPQPNEKDHRSDRWSEKPHGLLPCRASWLHAGWLTAYRVDARFTLASGP